MEKVKLLELDIDLEKLLKKGAEAKKSIEFLKDEVKFFQGSIKEGKSEIASYKENLSTLEMQGKKNTEEYKNQTKNLNELTKRQEESRQKLELVEASLRKEQKSYRLTKKGIDSYNKTLIEEIKIIEKTDGSRDQLQYALAENRKAYGSLTKEQQENTKIGRDLFKVINEQDSQYKELQKSVGVTQVEVGNYKEQIKELFYENGNLSNSFKQHIERIPLIGGLLSGVYSTLLKYATGQRAAIATTNGSSKALKLFRLALISTGIGALVVGLGSLIVFLTSTQKGVNKVRMVLTPLKTIFDSVLGVVQSLGETMYNAFSNPKESIKKLWETIKTNLINRIKGIGKIFKALGKIISSGFTDGYKDLANSSLQVATGVENVIDKTKSMAKETSKFMKEAYNRGKKIEELQQELSASEADFISQVAKLKKEFKAQNKIAEDQTKTIKERELAAKRSIEIQKEINGLEDDRLSKQIKLLKLKQQSNDTDDADRTELANLEAEREASQERQFEAETTQQNKLNAIRKESYNKAIAYKKKEVEEAIKLNKDLLAVYIAEQGIKAKTLEEDLQLAEKIKEKKIKILDAELKAKKISQTEYNLAVIQLDNDLAKKRAEITIDNAVRELEAFKNMHRSRIEANQFMTEELYRQEIRRLDLIAEKEKEYQAKRLSEGVINQQQYNDAVNQVETQNNEAKDGVEKERSQAKKEEEAAEFSIARIQEEERFNNQYDIDIARLESERDRDVSAAKGNKKLIEKIELESANKIKEIEEEKGKAKLRQTSETLGNAAELIGKHTMAGKAAGVAQATINTYQGVTEVWKAPSVLPEPFNTASKIAATGVTLASGLATVKKISSVKPPKKRFSLGGFLTGKSHAAGGVPFTIDGESGFEAEGGEFIVNKASTAKFRPLLEHINSQNGIKNINPSGLYQHGGIVTKPLKNSQTNKDKGLSFNYELFGEKAAEAVQKLPPSTLNLEHFNQTQNDLREIEIGASQ